MQGGNRTVDIIKLPLFPWEECPAKYNKANYLYVLPVTVCHCHLSGTHRALLPSPEWPGRSGQGPSAAAQPGWLCVPTALTSTLAWKGVNQRDEIRDGTNGKALSRHGFPWEFPQGPAAPYWAQRCPKPQKLYQASISGCLAETPFCSQTLALRPSPDEWRD